MKLLLVLIISVYNLIIINSNVCASSRVYQCAKDKLLDNKCIFEGKKNQKSIYYLNNCGKDEICLNEYQLCAPRRLELKMKKWQHEKCKHNEECLSGICDPDDKCGAIADGENCSNDYLYGCSNQSFCNSESKCQALIKENEDCSKDDDECDFGLICGAKTIGASKNCIRMFSIENDNYSPHPLLCNSGFSAFSFNEIYFDNITQSYIEYCAESSSDVETCMHSFECNRTISFRDDKKYFTNGECICSASGVQGFCDITTDKDKWKEYIRIYKEFIQEPLHPHENVQYLRKKTTHWDKPELAQAAVNAYQYALLKDADKCAIRYITSSNHIQLSFCILLVMSLLLV